MLDTVHLDLNQWMICLVVGSLILFASEAYKLILRARAAKAEPAAGAAAPAKRRTPARKPSPAKADDGA